MKNDQGQGHGAKFNREINLRQLVNAILSVRYVIPVLVTAICGGSHYLCATSGSNLYRVAPLAAGCWAGGNHCVASP